LAVKNESGEADLSEKPIIRQLYIIYRLNVEMHISKSRATQLSDNILINITKT